MEVVYAIPKCNSSKRSHPKALKQWREVERGGELELGANENKHFIF